VRKNLLVRFPFHQTGNAIGEDSPITNGAVLINHPPSPRLRRGWPAFVRHQPGYGAAGPHSSGISRATARQARIRPAAAGLRRGRPFLVPKLHLGTHLSRQLHCLCMIIISYAERSKASKTSSVPKCNLGTRRIVRLRTPQRGVPTIHLSPIIIHSRGASGRKLRRVLTIH
jgi:hypothetical protein